MAEYVDKKSVISVLNEAGFWEKEDQEVAIYCVEQTRSADVAPVKHGRWSDYVHVWSQDYVQTRCSECSLTNDAKTMYCPNCGAKMDMEDNYETD